MSRLVYLLALAALNGGAMAGWVAVHDHDDYIAYADPATVMRQGDLAQMRDLVDLKLPKPSPYGRQHASSTANSEFDCVDMRMRTLHFSLHSGPMGDGEVIETVAESNRWLPATPGTLLGILWQYACSQ